MPTYIEAQPITTPIGPESIQLPMGMRVNPYFDWATILGIPAWVWITFAILFIPITVNLLWVFKWKRMAGVRGYVSALKRGTKEDVMTWIITTIKGLTIECLRKNDTVLSFPEKTNITRWTHTSPMSVLTIGGKGGIIVSEDYTRSRDMISEIALCHACDEFNMNQATLREELDNPKDTTIKPINNYTDYEEFGRKALQLVHPEGLPIPSYSIFDPNRFRKYFPAGETAKLQGAVIIQDAKGLRLNLRSPRFWEKILPLGIFFTMGLIAIIAAWMVPLG